MQVYADQTKPQSTISVLHLYYLYSWKFLSCAAQPLVGLKQRKEENFDSRDLSEVGSQDGTYTALIDSLATKIRQQLDGKNKHLSCHVSVSKLGS